MDEIIQERIDVFVDGELAGYMTERRESYGVCEVTREGDEWRDWKHNGRQLMVFQSNEHQRVSLPFRHRIFEAALHCVVVASDDRDWKTERCDVCGQVHESLNCPPREKFHTLRPADPGEIYLRITGKSI